MARRAPGPSRLPGERVVGVAPGLGPSGGAEEGPGGPASTPPAPCGAGGGGRPERALSSLLFETENNKNQEFTFLETQPSFLQEEVKGILEVQPLALLLLRHACALLPGLGASENPLISS